MAENFVLAVNGGSSSLKCALFRQDESGPAPRLCVSVSGLPERPHGQIFGAGGEVVAANLNAKSAGIDGVAGAMSFVLRELAQHIDLGAIAALGHRVVHGGNKFHDSVWVDSGVLTELRALVPLAPLHQPINLDLIETCAAALPGVPQLACFDTAFHHHIPAEAAEYALPRELTDSGIRAYGFHGISYEYILRQLQTLDRNAADKKLVIAHLGAGASMCAVQGGKCIATSMGFSTLDGLPMATRVGSIDPGVLLHLMRMHDMTADQLEDLLYKKSGLLGLSGLSGDMRTLENADSARAQSAIVHFVYRASRQIASLAGALGGLDVLVFTGGIGANSASVRQDIAARCSWLGLQIDAAANASDKVLISAASSSVATYALQTNEELQIARHISRQFSRDEEKPVLLL